MARTDNSWIEQSGGYIEVVNPDGLDLLIKGSNKYINFNGLVGQNGYGIRDNNGVIEIKNSGGSWQPMAVSKNYSLDFITTDWSLNGENYELTITHNLDSSNPQVEVRSNGATIYPNSVSVIDSNSILLSVPATPDLRFNGSVAINAT